MKVLVICVILHIISSRSVYDMTEEEFIHLLGARDPLVQKPVPFIEPEVDELQIPAFDARDKWPECQFAVRDQGHCGSCWAFTITEVMAARLCIQTKGQQQVIMSPQSLVSCDHNEDPDDPAIKDEGCKGGFAPTGFKYAEEQGVYTEKCLQYTNGVTPDVDVPCPDGTHCPSDPNRAVQIYKCKPNTFITKSSISDIKAELRANGPMYCYFDVYKDFRDYQSGIYYQTGTEYLGGHAIKLVGWGIEDGINYWTMQNSWTSQWGENGFFRIRMGTGRICEHAYACTMETTH